MWLVLLILVGFGLETGQENISPQLQEQLIKISDDTRIEVLVIINQPYPNNTLGDLTIKQKAEVFKSIARNSQKPIIEFLQRFSGEIDSVLQFWIVNGIYLRASVRVIKELARHPSVRLISHIPEVKPTPIIEESGTASRTPEWNIQRIMADSCWYYGYTGDSIIIGMLDTGIDTTHPALRGGKLIKWRDFWHGIPYPYDDNGHGTACAGIICGGDGLGPFTDDIGVAPDVKLCVAMIGGNVSPIVALQWFATLKVDSGFDIRAINNAWGSSNQFDLTWWDICNNLKSLEILPVFSIGNAGPGSMTTNTPGNYPTVLGIGATNLNDTIVSFSSRGPAPDTTPWNDTTYWYRNDWNLTKPDLSAPGYSIRTAWLNQQYTTIHGTSFSCAHATGAVAILFEKNPNLSVTEIYNILLNNADRPAAGAPYPNNNYGWGRLNVWKALQATTGIHEQSKTKNMLISLNVLPNPFQNHCVIKFQIPITKSQNPNNFAFRNPQSEMSFSQFAIRNPQSEILLMVYDVTGRVVKSFNLASCILNQVSSIIWDGCDDSGRRLPAGVYFVRLEAEDYKQIEKAVLLR
ncbi:MAG: S8 family serine peptidase [candidate division WOR-3 bacterium]